MKEQIAPFFTAIYKLRFVCLSLELLILHVHQLQRADFFELKLLVAMFKSSVTMNTHNEDISMHDLIHCKPDRLWTD